MTGGPADATPRVQLSERAHAQLVLVAVTAIGLYGISVRAIWGIPRVTFPLPAFVVVPVFLLELRQQPVRARPRVRLARVRGVPVDGRVAVTTPGSLR